jgi:NitT/TauT family transport system ATP-binding protein
MILDTVCKAYEKSGVGLDVLKDFSLKVESGSITALVGPSGCGKTTLLRLIGGLEKPDSGTIVRDSSEEGPISYLFQEPRLLPWHTVLTNVELVLRDSMQTRSQRMDRAMHFLEMVELADFARFKPDELSGGMRQRVAIARAFAFPGKTMLLDEPFQSLDFPLRFALLKAFVALWSKDRRTTLFVTHDIPEALLIANEVVRLTQRPAQVADRVHIEIPQEERSLGDERLLAYQIRLYRELPLYT